MKQTTLFDQFDEQRMTPSASARRTDPQTSHIAAAKVEASGCAASDREAIRAIVCSVNRGSDGFPMHGWTAGEIANALGWGDANVRVTRRTVELERDGQIVRGRVRACTIKGTEMLTWHPME